MLPDLTNACFELVGAWFTWRSFIELRRDRFIAGIYWPTVAFFTAWGTWNLFYYPMLDQWASFFAGILLVSGNAAWVIQVLIIQHSKRSRQNG
jgi:hypothetical protein